MKRDALLAGAVPLLLAGCATVEPPALPLSSFAANDCTARPELAGAVSLQPEKDKRIWMVTQPIGAQSPCLTWEGANGPYLVFALPAGGWDAPIEVGSLIEGARIFSPHVVLLDESGAQMRTFTPEQYQVRSSIYSVQFMPQPAERYVLVTSNPARIGTSYDAIRTGTRTSYYYTAFGAGSWTSGVEAHISSGFSYGGLVQARVARPEEEDD